MTEAVVGKRSSCHLLYLKYIRKVCRYVSTTCFNVSYFFNIFIFMVYWYLGDLTMCLDKKHRNILLLNIITSHSVSSSSLCMMSEMLVLLALLVLLLLSILTTITYNTRHVGFEGYSDTVFCSSVIRCLRQVPATFNGLFCRRTWIMAKSLAQPLPIWKHLEKHHPAHRAF